MSSEEGGETPEEEGGETSEEEGGETPEEEGGETAEKRVERRPEEGGGTETSYGDPTGSFFVALKFDLLSQNVRFNSSVQAHLFE